MRLFMMFCVMLLLAGCDTRTSVERAQEAGVLIVGNNAEPQSFDPHIATSVSDFKMINAVMEGLLRGDSRDDAVFHPAVAETWTHSPVERSPHPHRKNPGLAGKRCAVQLFAGKRHPVYAAAS